MLATWIRFAPNTDDFRAEPMDEEEEARTRPSVRGGTRAPQAKDRFDTDVTEGPTWRYEQSPQTDQEIGWADEATRALITEEPW
jgi:hypothetical protein